MRTIVYADGGAEPNPGPGGWGVVIQRPEGPVEMCGGDRMTTNNRMELTAAIRALESFAEGEAVEMRCDSQYVVKSVTEWMPGWKRRGWRTATGPVKNQDLMEILDGLATRRDVRWTWVRGHAGEAGNELADRLATRGRREVLGAVAKPITVPSNTPTPPATRAAPGLSLTLEADLAEAVTRVAGSVGQTPQAFVADTLRLVSALGPDAIAQLKRLVVAGSRDRTG